VTLARGKGVGTVLVGVFGVVVFVMGVMLAVDTALTSDPGAMDTGFAQLLAVAVILGSTAATWWSLLRLRRFDAGTRRRALTWIGAAAAGAVVLFGSLSVMSVIEHRAEERALRETVSVRFDLEDDLSDAYWAWYRDNGGDQRVYVGNCREWWALDPDGAGQTDADAPVLRLLRDMGWSDRGVSMFDTDGDLVVDQLEWRPTPGRSDPQIWCVAVSNRGTVVAAHWSEALPRQCDGPPSSRVLP